MCGISIIINRSNNSIDRAHIEAMTDIIAHRGPDNSGYYFGRNFAFGHRRLAIIDLSPLGHQPMHYLDRYTIVANGEIYNYLELRDELRRHGYRFRSQSDTEVTLAAYDQWGEECVSRFNGMWAFAIHDREKETIFCSRDRFGIKPFYYSEIGGAIVFASEIKQFTAIDGWRARLNKKRAYEFLIYGIRNHSDETLFDGVRQLPAGHNLTYDLRIHNHSIRKWYDLKDKRNRRKPDFETAKREFTDLFTDTVRLRLRSDVKVGSCLSGGLDSSSIVCVVNHLLREQNAHGKQETVSSCFDISRYDEQKYIDAVAARTEVVSHRVFPRFDDLFSKLDKITWHQDEPFVSTSIFAQWEVFKAAGENRITVMLDGQGADELLGGYHIFYGKYLAGILSRGRIFRLKRETKRLRELQDYSIRQIVRSILGNLPPNFLRKTARKINSNEISRAVRRDGMPDSSEFWQAPTRTMREESLAEIEFTHLPILLHYEDRNSMAHSIESRVPFLDYRLAEFALNLPDEYKIKNAAAKHILRESLREAIPESILNRRDKMGFVTPEEVWLKQNGTSFRKELEDTIRSSNGLINRNILDILDAVTQGKRPFDFTIWRFIAFGRWLKVFDVTIDN
jgi:asparagine synthase (glutamine-hydrolysing)